MTTALQLVSDKTGAIAVNGKFAITPVGLRVLTNPSFEDWCEFGHGLQKLECATQWTVGDWLNYGERRWGEKYTQAIEETGQGYDALSQYKWVASQFELCTRVQNLSWSHHRLLASDDYTPERRQELLAIAVRDGLSVAAFRSLLTGNYHVSDDSYEWFTPAEYIDAARAVMGDIDLDPASCAEANKTIEAKQFYTKQDSGLDHKWSGRVWLNPPYNMPLIEDFANRAVESYKSGTVEQVIILTNNSTDTGWFHALAEYPFCLTRGRVKFWQPNSEGLGARQGQAIFYLGKNIKKFVAEFSKFGIIVAQYEHCRP